MPSPNTLSPKSKSLRTFLAILGGLFLLLFITGDTVLWFSELTGKILLLIALIFLLTILIIAVISAYKNTHPHHN